MRRLGEAGFTTIELAAVGGLLLAMLIPSLFLTHPKDYGVQFRNGERMVADAYIIQRVHIYLAQTGSLPNDITTTMKPIGTASGDVDLCKDLAAIDLKSFYIDPFFGTKVSCATQSQYDTGLGIQKAKSGGNKITVAALGSEGGKIVYLTD